MLEKKRKKKWKRGSREPNQEGGEEAKMMAMLEMNIIIVILLMVLMLFLFSLVILFACKPWRYLPLFRSSRFSTFKVKEVSYLTIRLRETDYQSWVSITLDHPLAFCYVAGSCRFWGVSSLDSRGIVFDWLSDCKWECVLIDSCHKCIWILHKIWFALKVTLRVISFLCSWGICRDRLYLMVIIWTKAKPVRGQGNMI